MAYALVQFSEGDEFSVGVGNAALDLRYILVRQLYFVLVGSVVEDCTRCGLFPVFGQISEYPLPLPPIASSKVTSMPYPVQQALCEQH